MTEVVFCFLFFEVVWIRREWPIDPIPGRPV